MITIEHGPLQEGSWRLTAILGTGSHVTGAELVAKTRHLLAPGGTSSLTFYRDPQGFYEWCCLGEVPDVAPTPEGTTRDGVCDVLEVARDGT